MEDESTTRLVANVHAVQGEDMEMDVQSQSRVRTLHGKHAARVREGHGAEAERRFRSFLERAGELAGERLRDARGEHSVVAEQGAKAPGQRADPVPDGHGGEHALLEVHGHVGHSPAETGWTETTALAAQADDLRVAAGTAHQMKTAF